MHLYITYVFIYTYGCECGCVCVCVCILYIFLFILYNNKIINDSLCIIEELTLGNAISYAL